MLDAVRAFLESHGVDSWDAEHYLDFGTSAIPRIVRLQALGRALESEVAGVRFILSGPTWDTPEISEDELTERVNEYVTTHGRDAASHDLSAAIAFAERPPIAIERLLDRY